MFTQFKEIQKSPEFNWLVYCANVNIASINLLQKYRLTEYNQILVKSIWSNGLSSCVKRC